MNVSLTSNATTPAPKRLKYHLASLWTDLTSRGEKPELSVKSLPSLDRKIWGIHRKKLLTIASRPGCGKSILGLIIAYDLASAGKNVVFFSLEMTVNDLLERLFSNLYNIDNSKLMIGKAKEYTGEWNQFIKDIENLPLVITERIGSSMDQVNKFVDSLNPKPDCLIVDHVGCIGNGSPEYKEVNHYIYGSKATAVKNDMSVILLNQINRDDSKNNVDKTPTLSGLKMSGAFEEASDTVILLHHPYHHNHSVSIEQYKIIIAKNRHGRTGTFSAKFLPWFSRIEDLNPPIKAPTPEVKSIADKFQGEIFNGRS